jgi:hypothetical protein
MEWYSAMLNFVLAVDGEETVRRSRSVILVRAAPLDFDGARLKALSYGRAMEAEYSNVDGKSVAWKLESIETIDWLGADLPEGREVYHEFSADFPRDQVSLPLDPDASQPGQSGV